MTTPHPRLDLEDDLSNHTRFSIVAALAAVDRIGFKELRDELGVSDSVLSRQISHLETAGFVAVKKGFVGKRPHTMLALSRNGLVRWQKHLEALRRIAGAS